MLRNILFLMILCFSVISCSEPNYFCDESRKKQIEEGIVECIRASVSNGKNGNITFAINKCTKIIKDLYCIKGHGIN